MKKRYARILAATLSAAMVFTSAPVNFTGIDLGVIEAKATAYGSTTEFETNVSAAVEAASKSLPYNRLKQVLLFLATLLQQEENSTLYLQLQTGQTAKM